jgi:hypothetical protein
LLRLKAKIAALRKKYGSWFSSSECTSEAVRDLAWVLDLITLEEDSPSTNAPLDP